MNIPTKTVRYTYKHTGWRRLLRRLTFRPIEDRTYEVDVATTGTYYDEENDSDITVFGTQPIGPARRVK